LIRCHPRDRQGLQEKYDIGALDWAVVDASGTPEPTLARCTEITRREAAWGWWCKAAMSAFQKSGRKAAPHAAPHRQRRTALAPPNATTACDTAFALPAARRVRRSQDGGKLQLKAIMLPCEHERRDDSLKGHAKSEKSACRQHIKFHMR
jgi:hypothetical protein